MGVRSHQPRAPHATQCLRSCCCQDLRPVPPLDGAPDKQTWCSSKRGKGKRNHSPGRTSETLMCQLARPLTFSTDTGSFLCQCELFPVMTMVLGSSGNQPPKFSRQILFVRSSNLWRTPTTVKYFGLSEDTLHSDAGFVLVKLQKPKVAVKTEGVPVLKPDAAEAFADIQVGDQESVKDFAENYGSHYIRSLTIGDAVYQILALDRQKYIRAKNDVLVEKKVSDFNKIYEEYLAPWIVKESGRVQAASGDSRVAEFLDER